MSTPAQVVEQYVRDGFERARDRKDALEDEQRKATLKTLQEDAETPADKVAAIQAVYHKDPGVLKQHVENLTRRLTGKQPQPVVSPQDAQQQRLAPLVARGKTPAQQDLDLQSKQNDLANQKALQLQQQKQAETFALIDKYVTDPEQNKALKEDYVRKQAGVTASFKPIPGAAGQPYKNANGQWVRPVQNGDGTIGEQPMPAGYKGPQTKPVFKVVKGHEVLIDPTSQKVIHDFGPTGSARTTTRDVFITDQNGVVHREKATSVSMPGGGTVEVDTDPSEAGETPKGPAPKKQSSAPRKASGAASPGKGQLDFRKATTAGNKARADYAEAAKLNSIAQQVAQHPNDAINQKRLAVALERASAGRFTTQALDYIIKSGWGNTIEQWANDPTTGALPTDVVRQLVDGAAQNFKASKDAITAVDDLGAPAPKSEKKPDSSKDPLGVL